MSTRHILPSRRWLPAVVSLGLALSLLALSLLLMTSPARAQSGSISGTVTYLGGLSDEYDIEVGAHVPGDGPPVEHVVISVPGGGYTIPGLQDGDYEVSVFVDVDGSGGPPDPGEPLAWYDPDGDGNPNPVTISGGDVSGIDITFGLRYVAPGGDCGGVSPCHPDVQEAVDEAAVADQIRVAAGTYAGVQDRPAPPDYRGWPEDSPIIAQVVAIGKPLTIRGGYTTTNWTAYDPDANPTVLDAEGQGRVLFIAGDGDVTVEGLRLTNGNADGLGGPPPSWGWVPDLAGGVYGFRATVTISDCWIHDNTAGQAGGLFMLDSDVTIEESTFTTNTAGSAGGLWLYQGDPPTLSGNTISHNTATNGAAGGLKLEDTDGTLSGNTISYNTAPDGAGAGMELYHSDATLVGNTIVSNTARYSAGGIYLNFSDATLIGNTIAYNRCNQYKGGGVNVWHSDAVFSHNDIVGNHAIDGGGLSVESSEAIIEGNTIALNSSVSRGGGLYVAALSPTIRGNTFYSNTSRDGGGLFLDSADATLVNNVIADNEAATNGGGMYIKRSSPRLLHTTLARNRGYYGRGIYVTGGYGIYSTVALTNTILVSHTVGIYVESGNTALLEATLWGSGAWANADDWAGDGNVFTGTLNIWGDPAFVDADAGDYHITTASDALDAGIAAGVRRDVDGQPRPMDLGYDIGADEYAGVGLQVDKRPSAIHVNLGTVMTYAIVVSNAGSLDAANVVLTDTLDAWQRPLSALASVGTCTVTEPGWGGVVVCQPGTMVPGTAVVVTLTAEVSASVVPKQQMINTLEATADGTASTVQVPTTAQDCHVRINDDSTEYTNVQEALDEANPGDLVKVAGTCLGTSERDKIRQLAYLDKSLTLRGGYSTSNWTTADPAANPTVLDALMQGRALVIINHNITPTVENLHLTGGDATGLGGGESDYDAGAGVFVHDARPTIDNCWIYGNAGAHYGGGVYLDETEDVTLNASTISSNTAQYGGGLCLINVNEVGFNWNDVSSNTATSNGGGFYLRSSDHVRLRGNTVHDNFARYDGGGLYAEERSGINLSGNTISANTIDQGNGGGLYANWSWVGLYDNTISTNTGASRGGGVYLNDCDGGDISGNTIVSNTTSSQGGGLYLYRTDGTWTNNIFADNQADSEGSGFYIRDAEVELLHTTIARNGGAAGQGAYLYNGVAVWMNNTILASHSVGIFVESGSTAELEGTLWGSGAWANTDDWAGSGSVITGTVNLRGDPAFVDPDAGDYHITKNSAAIDAGVDAGVDEDIDGDPRLGSPDLGADEYILRVYLPVVLRNFP